MGLGLLGKWAHGLYLLVRAEAGSSCLWLQVLLSGVALSVRFPGDAVHFHESGATTRLGPRCYSCYPKLCCCVSTPEASFLELTLMLTRVLCPRGLLVKWAERTVCVQVGRTIGG